MNYKIIHLHVSHSFISFIYLIHLSHSFISLIYLIHLSHSIILLIYHSHKLSKSHLINLISLN